jgi:adenylate cyclase
MEFSAKKYVIEKEYPLTREAVWKLLGDTDRLNRFICLFPVQFSAAKKGKEDVFYREAVAKVAGLIPLTWKEYPFQWVENEAYTVERRYEDGPLKHFVGGIQLLDSDDSLIEGVSGTKVRLFGEFTPRNMIGKAAIPLTGLKSMNMTVKYIDDYLTASKDKHDDFSPKKSSPYKINSTELTRLEKALADMPVEKDYIGLLHRHLIEKMDHEVTQMKPIRIAQQWRVDPDEVLRLFLYATKVGILNLSWNLICPNCRVSKAEYSSLSQLQEQFHCDLCGINYDANFENYVELYFAVHPSIRRAYAQTYCVGGPMTTPHVKIQKVIEKGTAFKLTIPNYGEELRLRVLQANHAVTIETMDKTPIENELAIEYHDKGWSQSSVSLTTEVTPVTIHNSSSNDIVLVIEQAEWSNEVVTAAKVTAMQEFRDLFSSEVLSPGQQVGIENVTILFSDLQGSTSLYELVGDANAYGQVRRHFDFLTEWIAKNSGSVVKTIGDAVMAVFHTPEDGLKAALHIQKHVSEFNANGSDEIILKIGLYSGPAIAVNSNDRLDYFGRTVNIAARIQGQSAGDDIVFSQDYLNQESTHSLLQDENINIQPFRAELKGISGEVDLIRLTLK